MSVPDAGTRGEPAADHSIPTLARRTTQRDVRRRNRTVVVSRLYFGGPVSRRELTHLTGLSTGAMTGLVGELLEEGIVEEAGVVSSDGGRPRTLVQLGTRRKLVIGVDIGEDRIRVGLFTLDLQRLDSHGEDLVEDELLPQIVAFRVQAAIEALMRRNEVGWERILGVGVGMLGQMDLVDGRTVVHAPTVGWDTVPIEELLAPGLGAGLFIDNGARALGQAEMWFGAGRGAHSAAVILHGTGVGAAYVTQSGSQVDPGFASEWGHTVLVYDGRACRCGSRGCLEAYIGIGAMLDRYHEIAPDRVPEGENLEASFDQLMADAQHNQSAFRIVAAAANRLGASLGGMMNALRPDRILLGGYAGARFGGALLPIVREAASHTVLRPFAGTLRIEQCAFGEDGVMTGAAALPVARWLDAGAPAEM